MVLLQKPNQLQVCAQLSSPIWSSALPDKPFLSLCSKDYSVTEIKDISIH